MTNQKVDEIKRIIGGMSNIVLNESTEPYNTFESWMGEIEQYVGVVLYDKKNVKKDYSRHVETERTTEHWWKDDVSEMSYREHQDKDKDQDQAKDGHHRPNTFDSSVRQAKREVEKEYQTIKKKNKWLL